MDLHRRPRPAPAGFGALAGLESVLGLLVVACVAYQVWFFVANGYLAQPFFYDTLDTLMDFHHTAFWSHSQGPYSVWNSIYPPLSFAILKIVTPAQCYATDPFIGRECNPSAWLLLVAGMVFSASLVFRHTTHLPMAQRLSRAVCVLFGLPALFGLERGNLVLWAVPALLWGVTRQRTDWKSALALAVAINLKPYMLLVMLPVVMVHGMRSGLQVVGACAVVYGASVIVVADGMPWHLLQNMQSFVGEGALNFWEKIFFSTSFSPVLRALLSELPVHAYMDSRTAELLVDLMQHSRWLLLLSFTLATAVAALQPPHARSLPLLTALVMGAALAITESFGGYTLSLLVALIFVLPAGANAMARALIACMLVACYMLSLPIDHVFNVLRDTDAPIWLSGRIAEIEFGLAVGQAVRPVLVYVVQFLLALLVIGLGWRAALLSLQTLHRRLASP